MATIPFSDYIASRPAATTPLDAADRVLIIQGGVVKQVASSDTGNVVPSVLINATITPITPLPASGEIVYVKADDSLNVANFAVSVVGQTMCLELQGGLTVIGETIRVKLIGANWYRIS
jgi:hypothetical protein